MENGPFNKVPCLEILRESAWGMVINDTFYSHKRETIWKAVDGFTREESFDAYLFNLKGETK